MQDSLGQDPVVVQFVHVGSLLQSVKSPQTGMMGVQTASHSA